MALKIYFHYDLSILAKQLSDNIAKEVKTAGRSPFDPVQISIPINHFKAWLPLQIALGQPDQVAANLKFNYLESALWDMLKKTAPENVKDTAMLERVGASMLVLAALTGIDKNSPGKLELLRNYLYNHAEDGTWNQLPDYEKRVWKLAQKLAGLLLDYEYHRREMVDGWLKDKLTHNDHMEDCQAALYRQVFPDSRLEETCTLPQLAKKIFKNNPDKQKETRHFFGFSELSGFHQELIWQLSGYYDIHLYQFNVCREFWEDVSTKREDWKLTLKELQQQLSIEKNAEGEELVLKNPENAVIPDNPLLKAWGKPGRELLRGYSDTDERMGNIAETLHPHFDNWKGKRDNILHRLQGQVLDRTVPAEDTATPEKLAQDKTLQIVSCPDIYREVETVYNSIIHNMDKDGSLKSTDITILVSDMARYKPVIQSVFSRKNSAVTYNLTDTTAEKDSVYGQGVMSILNLAESSYTRSELFEIFTNPCFMQAVGVSRADVDIWSDWVRELNIFRWADQEHKGEETAGSFTENLYTWEWGLKRLRLGRIMETEGAGECGIPPVYANMETRDAGTVSRFSAAVELLISRMRKFGKSGGKSPEKRVKELKNIFDTFLAIPRDRIEEAGVRNSLTEYLDKFAMHGKTAGIEFTPLLVKEVVKAGLSDIAGRQGTYGTGGVTVASIQNARPVPFRIVYIMGLEEKSFPADKVQSTLDLRTRYRKICDIEPREHGLFRFLEAFMAARDNLYLTYIGQDLQKDEEFQPSPAIKQLLYCLDEILEDPALPDSDRLVDFKVKYRGLRMPLHGFSRKYLENIPGCFDCCVNYSNTDKQLMRKIYTSKKDITIKDEFDQEDTARIEVPVKDVKAPRRKIDIRDLKHYLVNPVEGVIKFHLGIRDTDDYDPVEIVDEPFFTRFPEDYRLFQSGMESCLAAHLENPGKDINIPDILQTLYEQNQNTGGTPDGLFKTADFNRLLSDVTCVWDTGSSMINRIGTGREYFKYASIGASWNEARPELDPVILSIGSQEVELTGGISCGWIDTEKGMLDFITWKQRKGKISVKDIIDGFLFYSVMNCTREKDCGTFNGYGICQGEAKNWRFTWPSPAECKKFIAGLVSGILDFRRFDNIPWAAVEEVFKKGEKKEEPIPEAMPDFTEKLSEALSALEGAQNTGYYPMKILNILDVNIPENAFDHVRDHVKIIMEMPEHTEGQD